MRSVVLGPGFAKPLWMGHPWVYASSVARIEDAVGGEAVDGEADDGVRVVDGTGRTLGHGFLSASSAIRVRLLTRGEGPPDLDAVLAERVRAAVALRRRLFPDPARTDAYRLVHAEGDGLPGLVVDRLGPVLTAQFAIGATHRRRESLSRLLLEETGATSLVARASGYEEEEGIGAHEVEFACGSAVSQVLVVREEGLALEIEPRAAQKTGHYADQRENRLQVGRLCGGEDVLDLYAGTGGFSLQALVHGARSALAVESSARAAACAGRNAEHNAVSDRLVVEAGDVRVVLSALQAARRRFGVVIADPPNFHPRRGKATAALKAYRELNARALGRVADRGLLATFTCSARMPAGAFLAMLRAAARECGRGFSVLRELSAGPDHPVDAGLPEGRYLSGLLVRVHP